MFNAQHMNHAIYQFRSFEHASLLYANADPEHPHEPERHSVGLWDRSVEEDQPSGLGAVARR